MNNILYVFHEIEPARRPTIPFGKVSALQVIEASFTDGAVGDTLPLMAKLRRDSIAGRTLLNSRTGKPDVQNKAIVTLSEHPMSFDSDDEVTLCGQIVRYIQPPMRIGSVLTFGELQPNSNILFRKGNLIYRKVNEKQAQKLANVVDFEQIGPTAAERNIKRHPDSQSLEEFTEFTEVAIIHFLASDTLLNAMEG